MDYTDIRVIPGPDWESEMNQRSGIGSVMPNNNSMFEECCFVRWDMCKINNYRVGKDKKYDLLIYDKKIKAFSKNRNVLCSVCNEKIFGSLFFPLRNEKLVKCVICQMVDKIKNSTENDSYIRVDDENTVGTFVGKKLRGKENKYFGMQKGSKVIVKQSVHVEGEIIEFINKNNTARSRIKVRCKNEIKRPYYGYKGKIEVELKEVTKEDEHLIYRNHLQILGLPSFINYEVWKIYKTQINPSLFCEEGLVQLEDNDEVYILDYNTCSDNPKIKEKNGKCGTVVKKFDDSAEVKFDDFSKLNIRREILYTLSGDEKIVKVTSNKDRFQETIDIWKKEIQNSLKLKDEMLLEWIPEGIFDQIKGKFCVARKFTKTGDIYIVKFLASPYNFHVLLPYQVCEEVKGEKISIVDTLKDNIISLIKEDNVEGLILQMTEENLKEYKNIAVLSVIHQSLKIFEYLIKLYEKDTIKKDDYLCDLYEGIMKENPSEEIRNYFTSYINLQYIENQYLLKMCICAGKYGDPIMLKHIISGPEDIAIANNENNSIVSDGNIQNKYLDLMEKILRDNECDSNKNTALHLIIRERYFEVFFLILSRCKSLKINIPLDIKNNDSQTILHESAAYNEKDDNLEVWMKLVKSRSVDELNIFEDLVEKFKTHKNIGDKPLEMPFFVMSFLLLTNGSDTKESVFKFLFESISKKDETPEIIFKKSVAKFDKSLSGRVLLHHMRLFFVFTKKDSFHKSELCDFCKMDFAEVIYKPCNHRIHCIHCALMPVVCTLCNTNITEKFWKESGSKTAEQPYLSLLEMIDKCKRPDITNLKDFETYVDKLANRLQCSICYNDNWNVVFSCSHYACEKCSEKMEDKCSICRQMIEKKISINIT